MSSTLQFKFLTWQDGWLAQLHSHRLTLGDTGLDLFTGMELTAGEVGLEGAYTSAAYPLKLLADMQPAYSINLSF